MRTPIWESSAGALVALLNGRNPMRKPIDCHTVTLLNGTVLRWSDGEASVTFGGNTFAIGPGIKRSRLSWKTGVQVDTMRITVWDNIGTTINGAGLMGFMRRRGFDGARWRLDKLFWGLNDTTPTGALPWFSGLVADSSVDRHEARLSVKSDLHLLDVMVPRDVYQPGCLNNLFDSACGLVRFSLRDSATTTGASNANRTTIPIPTTRAAGYYSLGEVQINGGPNSGLTRTVKTHTLGQLEVMPPFPYDVASGIGFYAWPGCDGLQSTCSGKFNNLARFRGQPYVPSPETIA
jgi:uncharacterized phage protein (TIGR02218 family)